MINVETSIIKYATEFALASLLYGWILRRLADLVQPLRLRLAVLGERVLGSNPSRSRRDQTEFYLDHTFSGWVMPVASVGFPIAALFGLLKYAAGKFELTPEPNEEDDRMMLMFSGSVFAANPLFGSIVVVEFAIVALLSLMLAGPPAVMAILAEFSRLEMVVFARRATHTVTA
jgi:hypothetical protein